MYSQKTTTTGYVRPANMSHSVTVTRTMTTTTTSAIILNTGYLKTLPGILKVLEVILAGVCLGLASYYSSYGWYHRIQHEFFMCSSCSVFVGSICLLLACLCTLSTASVISKTMYELVYHFVAFLLMFASSITLLVEINHGRDKSHPFFAASIIGLILSALYVTSTILAFRAYRYP